MRAARSPVFVFCFVNQCTFAHWFWMRCSSCMQLLLLCYKVTGSLLMHATCSGILTIGFGLSVILLDFNTPCALRRWIWLRTSTAYSTPETQLWFPALKHNPLLWVSPWILCSYQLLQDEKLSIQQPQRKKTIPSPYFSYQRSPSSHRTSLGQTAIKTPALQWKGGRARTTDL